jgi:DNA-binding transcriptional MocR family regulator
VSRPPAKRLAAEAELLRDHNRTDEEVARAAGCSIKVVQRARAELLAEGAISRRNGARTAALRADPELISERPSVLARRHGLPLPYTIRVQKQVKG